MAVSSRICGVFAILYHLLILPVNGYIIPTVHHRRSISRVGYPILYSSIKNDNDVSSSAVPKALGTSGDWSAYLDESKGLVFYFNPQTGESTCKFISYFYMCVLYLPSAIYVMFGIIYLLYLPSAMLCSVLYYIIILQLI
jgi:hypothetical protein